MRCGVSSGLSRFPEDHINILPAVKSSENHHLGGVRCIGDDNSTPECESSEARTKIIARSSAMRKTVQAVTLPYDCTDIALCNIGVGLRRDVAIERASCDSAAGMKVTQ